MYCVSPNNCKIATQPHINCEAEQTNDLAQKRVISGDELKILCTTGHVARDVTHFGKKCENTGDPSDVDITAIVILDFLPYGNKVFAAHGSEYKRENQKSDGADNDVTETGEAAGKRLAGAAHSTAGAN